MRVSQVARHRTLTAIFVGSNPAPATTFTMDGHSIVNLLLVVIGFAIFPDYRPEMLIQPMGFKQQSAIMVS